MGWQAVKQPTPLRQQCGADLYSFCFLSSEPSQHPPQSSSRRVPSPTLHPRDSFCEIRKPVKCLKGLLSGGGGHGGWVLEVSVKRDFVNNMVFDSTSFHGFS